MRRLWSSALISLGLSHGWAPRPANTWLVLSPHNCQEPRCLWNRKRKMGWNWPRHGKESHFKSWEEKKKSHQLSTFRSDSPPNIDGTLNRDKWELLQLFSVLAQSRQLHYQFYPMVLPLPQLTFSVILKQMISLFSSRIEPEAKSVSNYPHGRTLKTLYKLL